MNTDRLLLAIFVLFLLCVAGHEVSAAIAPVQTDKELMWVLAIPFVIGFVGSSAITWLIKFVWRDTHPHYEDRLQKSTVILLAALTGSINAILSLWVLGDLLSAKAGFQIDTMKGYVGYGLLTGPLTPVLYGVLLWFVLTPIDFKVWKKPAWEGLYNFLNLPHKKGVDYSNGSSDLTRIGPVDFDVTGEDPTDPR